MKVVVFSDSHSDIDTMRCVVDIECPDMVIHLGDHADDAMKLDALYDMPFVIIDGNTDGDDNYMEETVVDLEGITAFITHGDLYDVETGIDEVFEKGVREGAVLILFGHTHKPYLLDSDGIWIMNPGRIGRISRKHINATYGVIDIAGGKAECRIEGYD